MTYKNGAKQNAGLSAAADNPHEQIAVKLRALYMSVQDEAIPGKFLDLLEQLDAVERQSARDVAE